MAEIKTMFIAVEGCVGAGKSTVAKGLAAFRNSDLVSESFESNPFLSAFYENPQANATETEFTFLCLHFHQLKTRRNAAPTGEKIADFHLGKDLLYAELNLKDAKTLRVFKHLYAVLAKQVPTPTLLICLSASTALLTDRIRQRKRGFELKVDPVYYAELNAAYERFFEQYDGRKLKVSMDEWDFVRTPALFRKLSRLVDQRLNAT